MKFNKSHNTLQEQLRTFTVDQIDRLDLRGADLRGAHLSNINLSGVDLSGADLTEANLDHSNLSRADLSGAYFREASLEGANLREAVLSQADFHKSYLYEANLTLTRSYGVHFTEADLSQADLSGAYLNGAYLSKVKLTRATLKRANLTEADLSQADLVGADLSGVKFERTNLSSANFRGSIINNSIFKKCRLISSKFTNAQVSNCAFVELDLRMVLDLETIDHGGRSNIDMSTLRKSRGLIPENFLKGSGLQDWEVECTKLYLEDMNSAKWTDILYQTHHLRFKNPIVYFSVFISYSHSDKAFAVALHNKLQTEGIRCWLDEHQMLPGDDIYEQIDHGIKHWDKLLLCCSKSSLSEKWWVDMEINKAFEKERGLMRERRKKVLAMIPLDLDGYLFSNLYENPKKNEITSRVAANFEGWYSNKFLFDESALKVIKALRADAGKRELPPAPLI